MVSIKSNDLEIKWLPPQSDTEARVPTAEELAASSHLHQQNLERAMAIARPGGLRNRPVFSVSNKSLVIPAGTHPYAPGHPALVALANPVTVNLPALADTVTQISRYDYVYLAVMAVEVTGAIDSDINLTFEWRSQAGTIQSLTQENTRRLRTVWAVIVSQSTTNAGAVWAAIPTVSGVKKLTASNSANGSSLSGTLQIYPLDPNLVNTAQYAVVEDTIELVDLCRVWRVQNFNQAGYVWGRTGEANFELDYIVQPTYRYVGHGWDNWEERARETLQRLFVGLPLPNTPSYDRAVQNLLNGQVGANADAPGLATASPNGSTALANDQRITFTNQAITQRVFCLPVATDNAGGFARATVPFQASSPTGAVFSANAADHKVYSATGRDITGDGNLTGLGGTGALVWTANTAAVATPGDTVYVQASIFYPAGSGFAVAGTIEKVFLDNVQINAANVRDAASDQDISAYTAPANGENFIVVVGRDRAALHYIYKRITASSDSSGRLAIPNDERGAIAYISGVSGRIDKPIVTGLTPSTSYNFLVYYPPRSDENWQFQWKTPRYKGTGERTFVDGSTVATAPLSYAHTQGGGNSTFIADGEVQYEAIAFRLPGNTLSGAVKHHSCNHRIQFAHEGDVGATSFRADVGLVPAAGLPLPRVGQLLAAPVASSAQGRGMAARLQAGGTTLGCAKLPIQCSQIYQLVVAFLLEKGGDRRLVAIAHNEGNPAVISPVQFDTDSPHFAAIDTFPIY